MSVKLHKIDSRGGGFWVSEEAKYTVRREGCKVSGWRYTVRIAGTRIDSPEVSTLRECRSWIDRSIETAVGREHLAFMLGLAPGTK